MPVSLPPEAAFVGPSPAAPARTGAGPSSDPPRLATPRCMHWGNTVPSPTMKETPHGLAPRMLSSHSWATDAYVAVPVRASYSAAITTSPAPWDTVSDDD